MLIGQFSQVFLQTVQATHPAEHLPTQISDEEDRVTDVVSKGTTNTAV